ncbi:MAG: phospholipase D-like domain-containing protein [Candidatus Eremiobacteraeota bacterium]|nr:phospholipase D-like domain-containing protein [Candidatus Eremiobacteraeota bacterium]
MTIDGMNFQVPQNISTGFQSPVPADLAATKKKKPKEETPKDSAEISGTPESKPQDIKDTGPTPEIIVMREKGLETLIETINDAKKSIDVHIYIITANTPKLMDAFKDALKRGVKVRLMVEDDPFYWAEFKSNPSEKAVKELVEAGAEYKPDNPVFSKNRVTHEKSMVFDGKKALILTGNLGSTTFDKNLDLGAIVINNPKVVDQVQTIFNSDWERVPLPEMEDVNLVISPDNAREKLEGLIGGAKKSIHVLQQGFSDKDIIALLGKKLKEGVETELTLTDPGVAQYNMQSGAYLALRGAKVKFLTSPYIHAKAIAVDSDEKGEGNKTYVGSQNFSFSAISKNRELGYIFSDKGGQLDAIIDRYGAKGFDIPSKMIVSDNGVIGQSMNAAIRTAEESITVETNLFSDKQVRTGLCKAAENGVKVRVMMPQNPFPWDPNCKFNIESAEELKKAGVEVQWSDDTYKSMQGTCMVVDGKEAIMFPDNISGSAFRNNVNYGVIDINEKEVADIQAQLDADWGGKGKKKTDTAEAGAATPTSELVSSPGNARSQLTNLLKSATSGILIETKEVSDAEVAKILKEKAGQGIPVKIILPERKKLSDYEKKIMAELQAKGVKIEQLGMESTSNNYIEVDKEKAYVGGHNLSKNSMDQTRGFGTIASHPEMLTIARKGFGEHWLMAALDQAKDTINVEKKFMSDGDRTLNSLLKSMAKKGVHVVITTGNYEGGVMKLELDSLNKSLRSVAALDPEKDKEAIAKFFNQYYDQDKAIAQQTRLKNALASLKPGEELIEGKQKDPDTIIKNTVTVDGKEVEFGDSKDSGEKAVMMDGLAGFGMLAGGFDVGGGLFEEKPEEFSDAEDQFLYHQVVDTE